MPTTVVRQRRHSHEEDSLMMSMTESSRRFSRNSHSPYGKTPVSVRRQLFTEDKVSERKNILEKKKGAVDEDQPLLVDGKKGLSIKQVKSKQKRARILANIPPYLAAIGKALKDGFGAMTLYSLIFFQELKLTAALLNPYVGIAVAVLAVSLFFISLGMEGKSLRARILGVLSKRAGFDLAADIEPLKPVHGPLRRLGMYFAIGMSKLLRVSAPWTAAACKGISGMGSTAGCLLLITSGMGLIASTALTGPLPWIILGFSSLVGVTLALVSRYKEGDEFITEATKFEGSCWERLNLPHKGQESINHAPTVVAQAQFQYPPVLQRQVTPPRLGTPMLGQQQGLSTPHWATPVAVKSQPKPQRGEPSTVTLQEEHLTTPRTPQKCVNHLPKSVNAQMTPDSTPRGLKSVSAVVQPIATKPVEPVIESQQAKKAAHTSVKSPWQTFNGEQSYTASKRASTLQSQTLPTRYLSQGKRRTLRELEIGNLGMAPPAFASSRACAVH